LRFIYVVLSQLKKMSGLQMLQPLPFDPSSKVYQLGKNYQAELARLLQIEAVTMRNNASFFVATLGQSVALAVSAVTQSSATTGPSSAAAGLGKRGRTHLVRPAAAIASEPHTAGAGSSAAHGGQAGSADWMNNQVPPEALYVPAQVTVPSLPSSLHCSARW
jgi:hypothetical protein